MKLTICPRVLEAASRAGADHRSTTSFHVTSAVSIEGCECEVCSALREEDPAAELSWREREELIDEGLAAAERGDLAGWARRRLRLRRKLDHPMVAALSELLKSWATPSAYPVRELTPEGVWIEHARPRARRRRMVSFWLQPLRKPVGYLIAILSLRVRDRWTDERRRDLGRGRARLYAEDADRLDRIARTRGEEDACDEEDGLIRSTDAAMAAAAADDEDEASLALTALLDAHEACLSPREREVMREVVARHGRRGWSVTVAAELGISQNTVRVLRHRAIRKLRAALKATA